MANFPALNVVIATRGRPELLRQAVTGALYQDYPGDLGVTVVYDQVEIDRLDDISVPGGRTLETIANLRSPGLPGARNTGILHRDAELVAFCDDDDRWLPGKALAQVSAWERDPGAIAMVTGIRIVSAGGSHDRIPPQIMTFEVFLADRITAAHPSSYLFRRTDLVDTIGLVDEDLPAAYGEDYDLLLRATHHGHVRAVCSPLVVVNWNRPSFFTGHWQGIADGLSYILDRHPEFDRVPRGKARIESQVAFAHAALGDGATARRWAAAALRHHPTQVRAYLAAMASFGIIRADQIVRLANHLGHGI